MDRLIVLKSKKDQKNHSVLIKDYIRSPIKLARLCEVGFVNYRHENLFYNITIENTCFRMCRWRYATTHIEEYFPGKTR